MHFKLASVRNPDTRAPRWWVLINANLRGGVVWGRVQSSSTLTKPHINESTHATDALCLTATTATLAPHCLLMYLFVAALDRHLCL